MFLHGRHENSDEHAVESDAQGIGHKGWEDFAADGAGHGAACPADVGKRTEAEEIERANATLAAHGNGVDFIRDAHGEKEAFNRPERRLHLLRKGNGHEGIAEVDEEGGDGHLDESARGIIHDLEPGELAGRSEICGGDERHPNPGEKFGTCNTKREGDGEVTDSYRETIS